ncbi:hypothetical protein P7K49_026880 [Saguinus oedipus]|uniref:Uncharacterized protein n=1 Tax=Saguinus oedipus TaxID=9490 RepID=A0ABQ9UEG7_SAGOE|nr:hypothetical protein P7K49_026880 [Saguinus oedipus]
MSWSAENRRQENICANILRTNSCQAKPDSIFLGDIQSLKALLHICIEGWGNWRWSEPFSVDHAGTFIRTIQYKGRTASLIIKVQQLNGVQKQELDLMILLLWATEIKRTVAEEFQKRHMEDSSQLTEHSSEYLLIAYSGTRKADITLLNLALEQP